MSQPDPLEATLVTAPGCHFCEEASDLLDDLAARVPLTIRRVPLASDEGRMLMLRHRAPFPPILLLDGVFFGHGRISRRKLERRLEALADSAAGVE